MFYALIRKEVLIMAKAKANYKVKGNTVIANVSALTDEELAVVKKYIALGFELKEASKQKTKTVAEMREDLAVDADALKEFNKLYSKKAVKGEKAPFHLACKYYNEWKKEQKNK